jgi:exopolysaccharide biosynthesis WecB/TagA/CpsF family protein
MQDLVQKLDRAGRFRQSKRSAFLKDPLVRHPTTVQIFGSRFICSNTEEAAKWIADAIKHPKSTPRLVTHVNVHNLRCMSPELRDTVQGRSWFLLEGIGLKIACLLTKGWVPPDTNGTDLFPALLDQLHGTPCRLFLLGSRAHITALAIQKIQGRWPHVEVVGFRDGYFSSHEIPTIRDEVARARPELLLIGLGAPKQETIALEFLHVPCLRVVWTVGGLFDFLSGRIPRAPTLMRTMRFEWLFRIFVQPRRLAVRYMADGLWLIKSSLYEWYQYAKHKFLDR